MLVRIGASMTVAVLISSAVYAQDALDLSPPSLAHPAKADLRHADEVQPTSSFFDDEPVLLQLTEPESVYAPPSLPRDDEGFNQGGVNLALQVKYLTDDVYRGVDYSEVGGEEDSPNLQFDGKMAFNLGKLPHPFVGVFVNVYNSDPISRFQQIRPYFGFDWTIRPFVFSVGNTTYIYPEREDANTGEAWARLVFDDSLLFRTERPILSPYVYAAYDYDLNQGFYIEAGVKHEFALDELGIVVTAFADVAYVNGISQQFVFISESDSGFSHFNVGLTGSYSLNNLLNIPRRFGEWSFQGYLVYTNQIDEKLLADTQLWGGVGIGFKY